MSKIDRAFYILIGLVLEPLCFSVMVVSAERPRHMRWIRGQADIATFNQALALYTKDVGRFPSSSQGLEALRTNPGNARWAGPYLRSDVPKDPWGRPYFYRIGEEGKPEVLSLGRDGKAGGRGDDQDISSLRLDEPIKPSEEFERAAAFFVAPACGIGYLFLPWVFRKLSRSRLNRPPS